MSTSDRSNHPLCLSVAHSQSHRAEVLAIPTPQPHRAGEELPGALAPGAGEHQGEPAARGTLQLLAGREDVLGQPGHRGHPGDCGHVPRAGHILHHQEGQRGPHRQQPRYRVVGIRDVASYPAWLLLALKQVPTVRCQGAGVQPAGAGWHPGHSGSSWPGLLNETKGR